MPAVLEGGCLCGKVRFSTTQPPLRTFACHCTFCQRMTGTSFYAESLFPMDAVQFNDGELRQYAHRSDGSHKQVFVHFCPSCGTTMGLTFERWPDVRAISRGCYDDPNTVELTSHIWTRSAQSGVALPADVDCFAGARAALDGQPEVALRHEAAVLARQDGGA
ncbi:GFA family protein [Variovorax boronicumulans]|uniref:GFA family protein n=1 Tax=Variovorax boronicumulans TaxID=436515 RepID=UPI001330894B|nr:GFA family protein [Variovorax boronicumulans]